MGILKKEAPFMLYCRGKKDKSKSDVKVRSPRAARSGLGGKSKSAQLKEKSTSEVTFKRTKSGIVWYTKPNLQGNQGFSEMRE